MTHCSKCNCTNAYNDQGICLNCGHKRSTTSTLNGQWPSDTWFRRAMARKLKADAQALEQEAHDGLPKVQS